MWTVSRKCLAISVAAILLLASLSGCTTTSSPAAAATPAVTPAQTVAQSGQASAAATVAPPPAPVYPMSPVTLTCIWAIVPADIDSLIGGDPNKIPYEIELEKETGVHINFTVTTAEDYDTKMNLLISSNDIPDLFTLPSTYTGGVAKAYQDGLLPDLTQYWDEYAPNYKKVLESNPEWLKLAKTDDGKVLTFEMPQTEDSLVYCGPMIRKDLLDKLGLPVPETIDEWYTALKGFKSLGVKWPFTGMIWFPAFSGDFLSAYKVNGLSDQSSEGNGVYPIDGKMVYGPIQPGFKEYLTTMNKWYTEGLIDPDFITLKDWGVLDTKMSSGDSAATVHFLSRLMRYTTAGQKTDPNFQMVAAPHPVLTKGDTPYMTQRDLALVGGECIYAKSPRLKEAIRYLDYGYSDEGVLLYNFGVKGESYTIDASGNPALTDMVLKDPNPKGWSNVQSMGMYCAVQNIAPTVQTSYFFQQTKLSTPVNKSAVDIWKVGQMPTVYPYSAFTDDEVKVVEKQADVTTYAEEMEAKFIMGTEPLSNFDKYVQAIKDMGIDQIIAAYQSAYDRFQNRK